MGFPRPGGGFEAGELFEDLGEAVRTFELGFVRWCGRVVGDSGRPLTPALSRRERE